MRKEEYLILKKAITYYRTLREVSLEDKIQSEEVAKSATKLFAEGDILAEVIGENKAEPTYEDYERHKDIILSPEDVIANLNGDLAAYYYLTPQGGAKWEAVANPNWNLFFGGRIGYDPDEAYLESKNRNLLKRKLRLSEFLSSVVYIPGSEKWEILKPWQATYWKNLPRGWRVTYQFMEMDAPIVLERRDSDTDVWLKADEKAWYWYQQISQWYTDPQFD